VHAELLFPPFTLCFCCIVLQAITSPLRVKLWHNAAFEVECYSVTAAADTTAERDVDMGDRVMPEGCVCPAAEESSDEVSSS